MVFLQRKITFNKYLNTMEKKSILMLGIVLLLSLTGCKKSYTIMVKSNNTEWGSVTGSGSYKDGETVTITAVPAEGHSFIRWNDGDATNPRKIVVCGDAEYVAMFSDKAGTIVHNAVIDYDGNSYDAIWIGSQLWMRENLRTTHYADGTEIPADYLNSSLTDPYYYSYTDLYHPLEKLGHYYNWPAAMHGEASSSANPSGVQGVCPSGWHLPSDAEWTTMEQTQTAMDVSNFDWRGDHAGKLAGEGWDASSKVGAPGNESDPNHNASGFSAFPAGFVDNGYGSPTPHYMGQFAHFWSATRDNIYNSAWCRDLYLNEARVNRDLSSMKSGFSVRCVRD